MKNNRLLFKNYYKFKNIKIIIFNILYNYRQSVIFNIINICN